MSAKPKAKCDISKNLFKLSSPLLCFSLVLLFNPNYNIIDILPDFIAYFILASLIGAKGEFIPYLAEAKEGFKRLGILSLLKIPCTLIMFANIGSGRDIIPLFTLVFSSVEIILLIGAVDNLFAGLYYVGERSDADGLITPFRFLTLNIKPEEVKAASYIALIGKAILAFLPEICLLTVESAKTQALLSGLYLPLLFGAQIIALAVGIIWLLLTLKYVKRVRKSSDGENLLRNLAGEEFTLELEKRTRLKNILQALSLLGFSCIFLLDLRFAESGEVNILPHFVFALVMLGVGLKLFEKRIHKLALALSAVLYSLTSVAFELCQIDFLDSFSYKELSADFFNPDAAKAYGTVELLAAFEAVSFLIMTAALILGFITFIRKNVALDPSDPLYSKADRDRQRLLIIKNSLGFGFCAIIAALKALNVYFKAEVMLIFGRNDLIFSNTAPWLDTAIFILVLLLTLFFHGTCEDIKEDVKFKFKDLDC